MTAPPDSAAAPWWRGAAVYQIYPRSFQDTNGDGMVSNKEWNRYQTAMWKSMKPSKSGMVPMTDVEAMMRGTPK